MKSKAKRHFSMGAKESVSIASASAIALGVGTIIYSTREEIPYTGRILIDHEISDAYKGWNGRLICHMVKKSNCHGSLLFESTINKPFQVHLFKHKESGKLVWSVLINAVTNAENLTKSKRCECQQINFHQLLLLIDKCASQHGSYNYLFDNCLKFRSKLFYMICDHLITETDSQLELIKIKTNSLPSKLLKQVM